MGNSISNTFLSTVTAKKEASVQQKASSGMDFQAFMSKATNENKHEIKEDVKKETQSEPRAESRNEPDTRKNVVEGKPKDEVVKAKEGPSNESDAKIKDKLVDDKAINEENQSNETSGDKSESDNSTVSETKSTTETKPTEEVVSDEAMLQKAAELCTKLAEIMQIPIEEVMKALAALQMKPEQMLNVENLTKFVQEALNLSNPVDLLKIPNIKQMLQEVKNVIEQFKDVNVDFAKLLNDFTSQKNNVAKLAVQSQQPQELAQTLEQTETGVENTGETPQNPTQQTSSKANTQTQTANVESKTENVGTVQTNVKDAKPIALQTPSSTPTAQQTAINPQVVDEEALETFDAKLEGITTVSVKETVQYTQSVTRMQQAPRAANSQEVINQLLEKLKVDVRNNISEVRVTLRPEHLGDVTLKVITENGIVAAQFVAESQRVKEIIEANFNALKNSLEQQGVNVSRLEVTVGQNSQDQRMDEFMHNQQKSGRRIKNIIDGISEEEAAETEQKTLTSDNSSVEFTA